MTETSAPASRRCTLDRYGRLFDQAGAQPLKRSRLWLMRILRSPPQDQVAPALVTLMRCRRLAGGLEIDGQTICPLGQSRHVESPRAGLAESLTLVGLRQRACSVDAGVGPDDSDVDLARVGSVGQTNGAVEGYTRLGVVVVSPAMEPQARFIEPLDGLGSPLFPPCGRVLVTTLQDSPEVADRSVARPLAGTSFTPVERPFENSL